MTWAFPLRAGRWDNAAVRSSLLLLAVLAVGCGNSVASDDAARAAYLGLDDMVEKALNLGFDGFNAASSANIPTQMDTGDVSGTVTVDGQVDQGASANKGMRLELTLVDYQDVAMIEEELAVVYETGDVVPRLDLSLRGIPDGTLTGSLDGDFFMIGDIEGAVTMNLTFAGEIEPDPADMTRTRRVPGSTTITGTATSDYGVFDVDVTR